MAKYEDDRHEEHIRFLGLYDKHVHAIQHRDRLEELLLLCKDDLLLPDGLSICVQDSPKVKFQSLMDDKASWATETNVKFGDLDVDGHDQDHHKNILVEGLDKIVENNEEVSDKVLELRVHKMTRARLWRERRDLRKAKLYSLVQERASAIKKEGYMKEIKKKLRRLHNLVQEYDNLR